MWAKCLHLLILHEIEYTHVEEEKKGMKSKGIVNVGLSVLLAVCLGMPTELPVKGDSAGNTVELIDGVEVAPESELSKWQYTLDEDNKTITLGNHINTYGTFGSSTPVRIDEVKLYGKYRVNGEVYDAVNLTTLTGTNKNTDKVTVGIGAKITAINFSQFGNPTHYLLQGADTSGAAINFSTSGTYHLRTLDLEGLDLSNYRMTSTPTICNQTSLQHVSFKDTNPNIQPGVTNIVVSCTSLLDVDFTGVDFDAVLSDFNDGWIDRCPNMQWVRFDVRYKDFILNNKIIGTVSFSDVNTQFPRLEYVEFMQDGVPVERVYTSVGEKVRDFGDTTWQSTCRYTLDEENKIIHINALDRYHIDGTRAGCYIYDTAVINGVSYETRLDAPEALLDGGMFEIHGDVVMTAPKFIFGPSVNFIEFIDGDVDTSAWTDMSNMFREYVYLRDVVGMKNLDTQNVRTFKGCFSCGSSVNQLTGIDVSHFDFSSAEDISGMFGAGQYNMTEINIPNLYAPNCTKYGYFINSMNSYVNKISIGDITLGNNTDNYTRLFDICDQSDPAYDLKEFEVGDINCAGKGIELFYFESEAASRNLQKFTFGDITLPNAIYLNPINNCNQEEIIMRLDAANLQELHTSFLGSITKKLTIVGDYGDDNHFILDTPNNSALEYVDLSGLTTELKQNSGRIFTSPTNLNKIKYLNIQNVVLPEHWQTHYGDKISNYVPLSSMAGLETFVTPRTVAKYVPIEGQPDANLDVMYGLPKTMYDWDNYDMSYVQVPQSDEEGQASRTLHSTRHWANIEMVALDGTTNVGHNELGTTLTCLGDDYYADDTLGNGDYDSITSVPGLYTSSTEATGDITLYKLEKTGETEGTCIQKIHSTYETKAGAVINVNGDYGDHDWNNWVTVTPAGAGVEGLEERVCKTDPNHKETRPIPALPVPTPPTPPTTPPTPPTTPKYTLTVVDRYDDVDHIRQKLDLAKGTKYSYNALLKEGYSVDKKTIAGDIQQDTKIVFTYTKNPVTTGTISGVILENATTPLKGAIVDIESTSVQRITKTGTDGKFEFKDVPVGQYALDITYNGKLLGSAIIRLDSNSSSSVTASDEDWNINSTGSGLRVYTEVLKKETNQNGDNSETEEEEPDKEDEEDENDDGGDKEADSPDSEENPKKPSNSNKTEAVVNDSDSYNKKNDEEGERLAPKTGQEVPTLVPVAFSLVVAIALLLLLQKKTKDTKIGIGL